MSAPVGAADANRPEKAPLKRHFFTRSGQSEGGGILMRRWALIAFVSLLATTVSVAPAIPWLAYWIGLRKIDGFPAQATHSATAEEVTNLYERLRISQPVQIDPISPYTYLLQGPPGSASGRIAWVIASAYNVEHLADRRYWHLAGAAMVIWLTRNWTPDELIARAAELESRMPQSRRRQN